jgi:hypothetical protein
MFICKFASGAKTTKGEEIVRLVIEHCPNSGVDAIDFREKSGLLALPTNVIIVPGRVWRSEEFCRKNDAWLDDDADLDGLWLAGKQLEWDVNSDGVIYEKTSRRINANSSSDRWPLASAACIKAYLFNPTDESCAQLWENIWAVGRTNLANAKNKAAAIIAAKEDAKQKYRDACSLLQAELAELVELRRQVALLKERIAFLTPA